MKLGLFPQPRQSGVSLIEAMVALVVLAIGIMVTLNVQLKSMVDNHHASQRVIAVRLADNLLERMKSNAGGMDQITNYVVPSNLWRSELTEPQHSCASAPCSHEQQARYDLWLWRLNVDWALPGGLATTFRSTPASPQLGVMIAWPINQTDVAKNSAGDGISAGETSNRYGFLDIEQQGGVTCPDGMVCHFAYGQP